MSDVKVKVNWSGDLKFTGVNSNGHETILDGNKATGASPVEILLEAVGACSAVDVVTILDKQRTPASRLEITVGGDRHNPEPRYFTRIEMNFDIWGEGLKAEKVARAIDLSIVKYCSVFQSLRKDIAFSAGFRLHSPGAEAAGEYLPVDLSV